MFSIRTKDSDKFSKKLLLAVEKTVRIFNQITMLAPALCILYEPGVVRSLCILAVPAHVKESGQKVAVAVQSCTCQRIESSGLTKIMNS